jgi:hypothetical protein
VRYPVWFDAGSRFIAAARRKPVPTIKFWVDGTVYGGAERPLTDAEKAAIVQQEHLSKWSTVFAQVAWAASVLTALIVVFGGNRTIRHRCDLIAVGLGGLALTIKYVMSRRP